MPDWSFQKPLVAKTLAGLDQHRRVVLCSCTGSGKTRMMQDVMTPYLCRGEMVAIYTNRKILCGQLHRNMYQAEFDVAELASGKKRNLQAQVQVCMIPTLGKCKSAAEMVADKAGLLIVDEAHMNSGKTATALIHRHLQNGCHLLGVTATPVNLRGLYCHMVKGPRPEELEESGVLVPVDYYAPTEIETKGLRAGAGAAGNKDYSDKALMEFGERVEKMGNVVIGNLLDTMQMLNPRGLPAICFAPSVASSRWLSKHFTARGYAFEHIDANTPQTERDEIFDRWRSGDLQGVCNCNVLKEAFDFPSLFYAMLVSPSSAIHNAIQIVGRVRRSSPGKTRCIIADHVGNWWRNPGYVSYHGWELGEESVQAKVKLEDDRNESGTHEVVCPKCGRVWRPGKDGSWCPGCGEKKGGRQRNVIQKNGTLKRVDIDREQESKQDQLLVMFAHVAQKRGATANWAVYMTSCKTGRPYTGKWPIPGNNKFVRPCEAWPWMFQKRKKKYDAYQD